MSDYPERPPGFVYRSPSTRNRPWRERAASGLFCEQLGVAGLAKKFGTPLYVYSASIIRDRILAFNRAFAGIDHRICYSVKANSNLSILRLLAKHGCGFDVVSGGELARVRRASPGSSSRIVFSGVGKTAQELEAALRAGILLFNIESASEMEVLAACAEKVKKNAAIAFRVNPDVPASTHPYISTGLQKHKFGVPISAARQLYRDAAKSKRLRVAGISVHIGSQINDYSTFAAAMERIAELARQVCDDGSTIKFIDAGGGLGISYGAAAQDFGDVVRQYAKAVITPLAGLRVKLLLEPGRSIVGPAGILLTRVLYRKSNGGKKFVIVDGAMNDLIRPSLYQAEHQIAPVEAGKSHEERADIVGPICESGDFFARDRKFPTVQEGDLLAIFDTGAYGMSLSSNYNSRPRAAEVLVSGRAAKLIRRRESIADLLRAETGV